jgi:hypothetical protein
MDARLLCVGNFPVVIPAKAGIHLLPTVFLLSSYSEIDNMDSRFRGNDESRSSRFRGNDDIYRVAANSISFAILRSFWVMPPASWVVSMQVIFV